MKIQTILLLPLRLAALTGVVACQGTAPDGLDAGDTGGLGGAATGGQDAIGSGGALGGQGGDDSAPPLFAAMYEVYDDHGSTSYLSFLDRLDIDEVDTSQALEYGEGRAFVQTYDGDLFVGDASTPTVTRFSVGADGELIEKGVISFANYGLSTGQFDTWNVAFISPEKAYLMDFRDGTTIIWDPSTMLITGDIPPPDEFLREGWQFESSPGVVRDGLMFRTVDWANYDENSYCPEFLLAVYDLETDEVIDITVEDRCAVPGNLVHMDEEQNIYFSNWVWPVEGTILRGAVEPCVLRISAGEATFDDDWLLDYRDVTDDHYGAMFTYLGEGNALVAAFYDENTSFDETTEPWSYIGSNNWRLWQVDIDDLTGNVVEGLGWNGGAFTPARLDGRLHLLVPGGAEANWATQLYEIVDGRAESRVKFPGWSYQIVQVR